MIIEIEENNMQYIIVDGFGGCVSADKITLKKLPTIIGMVEIMVGNKRVTPVITDGHFLIVYMEEEEGDLLNDSLITYIESAIKMVDTYEAIYRDKGKATADIYNCQKDKMPKKLFDLIVKNVDESFTLEDEGRIVNVNKKTVLALENNQKPGLELFNACIVNMGMAYDDRYIVCSGYTNDKRHKIKLTYDMADIDVFFKYAKDETKLTVQYDLINSTTSPKEGKVIKIEKYIETNKQNILFYE